jgi:hypothetical protein
VDKPVYEQYRIRMFNGRVMYYHFGAIHLKFATRKIKQRLCQFIKERTDAVEEQGFCFEVDTGWILLLTQYKQEVEENVLRIIQDLQALLEAYGLELAEDLPEKGGIIYPVHLSVENLLITNPFNTMQNSFMDWDHMFATPIVCKLAENLKEFHSKFYFKLNKLQDGHYELTLYVDQFCHRPIQNG